MINLEIGGFFELEINQESGFALPEAYGFNTGRACLNFLIQRLRPNKVYLPFYTCDALIAPLVEYNIPYQFYEIDKNFKPVINFEPNNKELIIVINYFGLLSTHIKELLKVYGRKMIVDETHNFFVKPQVNSISFTNLRKNIGAPDGAFLYGFSNDDLTMYPINKPSILHNYLRLIKAENAYQEYTNYENSLNNNIKRISEISKIILKNLDINKIRLKRIQNFNLYHSRLRNINLIDKDLLEGFEGTPFCYPLVLKTPIDLNSFHKNKIFIPNYWLDCQLRSEVGYDYEKYISKNLLPLPLDHRYGDIEVNQVIDFILKY